MITSKAQREQKRAAMQERQYALLANPDEQESFKLEADEFYRLTPDEWFQAYRIIRERRTMWRRCFAEDAIACVVADRGIAQMRCHGGSVWTL